jgi:copper chaperone CopZ
MKRLLSIMVPFIVVLLFMGCQSSVEEGSTGEQGNVETVTFNVDGMYCGSCAGKVEKAILAADGVMSCQVDYRTKKVVCTYDKSKTTAPKLIQTTKDTPYSLSLEN